MRSHWVAVAVLAAVAVVAVPPAGGQDALAQANQVRVEAAGFGAPIEPVSGLEDTNVTVAVPCGSADENGTSRAVRVEVASKPEWVGATLSPSTVFIQAGDCDASEGTASSWTSLVVQTTAQAPAFEPANLTLRASSDGMEPGTDDVAVEAGFRAVVDAQTPKPAVAAGPDATVDLPVQVTNFGNGPVAVTAQVVNGSGALEVTLPDAFTLGAKQKGADHVGNVTVSVRTPAPNGYVDDRSSFEVRWSARYEPDPSVGGAEATSRFRIATRGIHVPGPGAAAALAVLAGAGLASAGRRRPW